MGQGGGSIPIPAHATNRSTDREGEVLSRRLYFIFYNRVTYLGYLGSQVLESQVLETTTCIYTYLVPYHVKFWIGCPNSYLPMFKPLSASLQPEGTWNTLTIVLGNRYLNASLWVNPVNPLRSTFTLFGNPSRPTHPPDLHRPTHNTDLHISHEQRSRDSKGVAIGLALHTHTSYSHFIHTHTLILILTLTLHERHERLCEWARQD